MFKEDLFMMRTVCISDDFDLEKIRVSGQCFRVGTFPDGTYRVISGDRVLYIREGARGEFSVSCSESEWDEVWRPWFDLDRSYSDIRDNCRGMHPFMDLCMESGAGLRILKQDYWEMLITFIISQNRNIPAIRNSVELLAERCGEKKTDSRGKDFYAFPKPGALAALAESDLKSCKLGYRCKYVHAAAEAVSKGDIDLLRLLAEDEASTINVLTKLFGVGTKVANCVSLFGLHHVNAFPVDVWIRRVLEEQYPNGYPYEKYAPYNGIYQQYMFAYYRNK